MFSQEVFFHSFQKLYFHYFHGHFFSLNCFDGRLSSSTAYKELKLQFGLHLLLVFDALQYPLLSDLFTTFHDSLEFQIDLLGTEKDFM